MASRTIDEILSEHRGSHGGLIAILQEAQSAYGYLPREVLECIADRTGRSLVEVYSVATFFRAFSLKPRGKHLVCVCTGTACHVRGASRIFEEFTRVLGVPSGQTTADGQFTLETVNCLGACALGPIVMVDRHCFSNVDNAKVAEIVDQFRNGQGKKGLDFSQVTFEIEAACPRCGESLMDSKHPIGEHPSIGLKASFGGNRTDLWHSALYGDSHRQSSRTIPEGTVLELSCPHCKNTLLGDGLCPECGSPTVVLRVGQDCVLQLCARYGCDGHVLDIGRDSTDLLLGQELSREESVRP